MSVTHSISCSQRTMVPEAPYASLTRAKTSLELVKPSKKVTIMKSLAQLATSDNQLKYSALGMVHSDSTIGRMEIGKAKRFHIT